MSTLAFGCEVPKFPMQRQALIRLAGTVEVRAQCVVPLHKSSVVQAGDIHAQTLCRPWFVVADGHRPTHRALSVQFLTDRTMNRLPLGAAQS